MILNDLSPCPFGKKYRGMKMQDVPVDYLHWFWNNIKVGDNIVKAMREYIWNNINALKEEDEDLIWDKP